MHKKKLVRTAIVALIALGSTSGSAETIALTKDHVFSVLYDEIGALQTRYHGRSAAKRQAVENLRLKIDRLDDHLDSGTVSQQFLLGLMIDADILRKASQSSDADTSFDLLKSVSDDVAAKVDTVQSDFGFQTSSWDGTLKVEISALHAGRPVNGLLVRINMAGLPERDPPYRVINELTSPAHDSIPPGLYFVLLVGPNNQTVARQMATVKGTPGELVKISVLVP